MKNLVIGVGQIGTAIQSILMCDGHDPFRAKLAFGDYDVLHICYPCVDKESFVKSVQQNKQVFNAKLIVIHSTVSVGVTSSIGSYAVHSPIRGVHPHLEEGIRTFTKFFGGVRAKEASEIFTEQGIDVICTDKPETTELMKLVDTTTYGINILIEKEIYRLCKENGVDFNVVYTQANKEYNRGYLLLNMPQYQKYILEHRDGAIGGHCIMPNIELFSSWMCDLLKEKTYE